jgi:hypothetical protein
MIQEPVRKLIIGGLKLAIPIWEKVRLSFNDANCAVVVFNIIIISVN